jgi:hypothetical protein
MEMSDRELDRILAEQARDRDRREAAARIADRYISRDGGELNDAKHKAKAAGLTVIDGDKAEPKSGASVLDKTYAFIGRFVAYPSDHARVAHTFMAGSVRAGSAFYDTVILEVPQSRDEDRARYERHGALSPPPEAPPGARVTATSPCPAAMKDFQ